MITSINCLNFIAVFKAFRKSRIFAVKKVEESVIGNRYFKKLFVTLTSCMIYISPILQII